MTTRWNPLRLAAAVLLILLIVVVAIGVSTPTVTAAAVSPICDSRAVTVNPGIGTQTIRGTYCRPADSQPNTIFVLVPGATYNRAYWDFPYRPEVYSVSRALARAGYASFAIDRLGTGASTKPLSTLLTSTVQADAVHQVIGQLRATGFDGHTFPTVLLGGHSLGSAGAVLEAATYHDVDGLLLTGFSHALNIAQVTELLALQMHPALLDPQFVGTTVDPGYLTTVPGKRKEAFHDPGVVDPAVIQADEATKDLFAATETPDAAALAALLPYSTGITAPTLIVDGASDTVFCGPGASCATDAALLEQERPSYPNARCLDAYVLPGVGHDVNLHPDAPHAQARIIQWADALLAGQCPNGT